MHTSGKGEDGLQYRVSAQGATRTAVLPTVVSSTVMSSRHSSASQRKPRRASTQQIVFAAIGLLVIVAFILSMLR